MTNRDSPKVHKCTRCKRRHRGHGEWNFVLRSGHIRELVCPGCQTPEENAEAEVNAALLNYSADHQGRIRAKPKAGG